MTGPSLRSRALEADAPTGSLTRYEAILASTLDPIVIIDATGVVQEASDSVQRVFGWPPGELVGRNVSVLMPEPHHSAHDRYLDGYRRTGRTSILGRTREFEGVRRDGTVFPVEISVTRVDVPGQAQPLFAGILRDVTRRKRAEEESRLLRGIALAVAEAGDLPAAMSATLEKICAASGWSYGEVWIPDEAGRTLVSAVHHATDPALEVFHEETIGQRFAPGEGLPGRVWATRMPRWVADLSDESVFARSAAAGRAGLRSGIAIPISAGPRVVAVMAFFTGSPVEADRRLLDLMTAAVTPLGTIIVRKRAEAALAESERRFRDALRGVELIAVILDRDGRVSFCNRYLLELTGWVDDEHLVLGDDWFERFIPADQRDVVRQVFREAIDAGRVRPHFENEIVSRDGRRRLVSWNNTVLRDGDGIVSGVTGLGIDVTDQRRAERELALEQQHLEETVAARTRELEAMHAQLRIADRLASIGTLAAGLGHDMNNVLLPIRCRLDALQQGDMADAQREHFESVRRSVEYLQQLTDGLHLLALDPDQTAPAGERVDLARWWERVGQLLGTAVPRHAALTCELPAGLAPVSVAPHRLTQAVLNLIVNSGEAVGPQGTIRIWAEPDADGRFVRLGVTDDGPGMPEEVKRRALDPFFTTKRRGLGTGLGLSLVDGVAKSAGGSVDIESEAGRGTTVAMSLPIVDTSGEAHPAEGSAAVITLDDRRLASLLVAVLGATGVIARVTDDGTPPDAELWITDPARASIEHAETYLSGGGRRRLVLVGAPDERWQHLDTITIERSADFEAIRARIGEAVAALARTST